MADDPFLVQRHGSVEYVQAWYLLIADLTFRTSTLPLAVSDGRMLISIMESRWKQQTPSTFVSADFDAFKSRVETFIDAFVVESPPNLGFFARLGSRSPKDSVLTADLASGRFANLLYECYLADYRRRDFQTKQEKIDWLHDPTSVYDILVFYRCWNGALRITNFNEMWDLFSESERIYGDIRRELDEANPNLSIAIREWDPRVRNDLEFRAFVVNHRIVALTQYDDRLFSEDVVRNKERIEAAILRFQGEMVAPRLSVESSPMKDGQYVIDFGVILQGEDVTVVIIEINRMNMNTGGAMFDWSRDYDQLVGRKEFEFRVASEQDVDVMTALPPESVDFKTQAKRKVVSSQKTEIERTTWPDSDSD
jgi:hypothetical protein